MNTPEGSDPETLPDAVASRVREALESFANACRSGEATDRPPEPDAAAEAMARLVRSLARGALVVLRDRLWAADPTPTTDLAGPPNPDRTGDYTPDQSSVSTPATAPVGNQAIAVGSDPGMTSDLQDASSLPVDGETRTWGGVPEPGAPEEGPTNSWDGVQANAANAPAGRKVPTVPGYLLTGVLGRGGMGVVYQATQLGLNRTVALKMILAGGHAGETHLARFQAEARAVAALKHPNIVQIYEIGEHDGLPYFSLESCPGGSLDKKANREPLPPREAAALVEKLARAMAAAHAAGIIHRDLKPANVLLDADGQPKITDFGLARELDAEAGPTQTGGVLGTPSYMAPEQAAGRTPEIGPHSDQYGLGATLYDLLTGRPPFKGTSVMDTLEQVRTREPVAPSQLQPGCPRDLETVCLKAMAKEPGKRYAGCAALADDLRAFLDGRPIAARPVGSVEKAWRWAKRNPRVAAPSAAAVVLLVATAVASGLSAVGFSRLAEQRESARVLAEDKRVQAEENEKEQARLNDDLRVALNQKEEARKGEEQNFALARGSITRLASDIPARLGEAMFSPKAREAVLRDLADMLTGQLDLTATRGLPDRALMEYHHQLAEVRLDQGDWKGAVEQYQKALVIAERLVGAETREKDKAKGNLALLVMRLGDATLGPAGAGWKTALEHYARAEKLQREVVDKPETGEIPPSEAKQSLATTLHRTADLLRRIGQLDRAAAVCQEVIKYREAVASQPATRSTRNATRNLGASQHLLGRIAARQGKDDAAAVAFEAADRLMAAAVTADPDSPALTAAAATVAGDRADFLLMRGKFGEAGPVHDRLLALQRQLVETPELLQFQDRLGMAYYRVGTLARARGERATAQEQYGRCLRTWEQVADAHARQAKADPKIDPLADRSALKVGLALARLGRHAEAAATFDRLCQKYPKAVDVWFDAACGYGLCAAAAGETDPDDPGPRDKYMGRALAALDRLIDQLNWADPVRLRTDPDLAPVRDDPRFKAVLRRAEEKKAAPKK